jgi:hypothetical protein
MTDGPRKVGAQRSPLDVVRARIPDIGDDETTADAVSRLVAERDEANRKALMWLHANNEACRLLALARPAHELMRLRHAIHLTADSMRETAARAGGSVHTDELEAHAATLETILQTGGPMTRSVYVASSWRNALQPGVVSFLREHGHEVYDFRNPAEGDHGFSWRECDPSWIPGSPTSAQRMTDMLATPAARRGFDNDSNGMSSSWACVLVLPCGRSAHLEAGWFAAMGRPLVVFAPSPTEPELMYLLASHLRIVDSVEGVREALAVLFGAP